MLRVPSEISEQQFESIKLQETTFVAYRNDVYPAKNDIFFEEHALVYVLEGDKKFSSTQQEVHVKKGDLLFIQQGFYVMSESLNAAYKSLVFFFNDKLIKEFATANADLILAAHRSKTSIADTMLLLHTTPSFDRFIDTILPYFQASTPYLTQFLRLKYQELLLHLLTFDTTGALHHFLRKQLNGHKVSLGYLMNEYYLKPLSLSELARLSGRSLSVFKRDFAEEFGTSPARWIKQKRMEQAHYLLRSTTMQVAEVSHAIGYESISHFIREFKQVYGVTPKQLL